MTVMVPEDVKVSAVRERYLSGRRRNRTKLINTANKNCYYAS